MAGFLSNYVRIPSQLRIRLPRETDIVVDVWGSLLMLSAVADGVRRDPKAIGTCTEVVLAFHPQAEMLRQTILTGSEKKG